MIERLRVNLASVVLGKKDVIEKCLVALLAGEHLLLEDVPGVGKTLIGKALAKSVAGEFARIQFTPDLLPSDILGSSVFHTQRGEFVFHRGPLFANIVLADEINRAPPRTQSALLEAMSDRQVSTDRVTHALPHPFMVIATQNPFEFEGTYALPESQLDRFLMRVSIGYPDAQQEREVLRSHRSGEPVDDLEPVLTCEQVGRLQELVRTVRVDSAIDDYLLEIIHATREHPDLHVGVSTRAGLSLYRAAQSLAMVSGRDYVVPDDVKQLAVPALAHRVLMRGFQHSGRRDAAEQLISDLVQAIAVPA
ncbi:MAG: MoxR family ATPase [Planctomycetales bacterium]|nr:MoxR family ATPase [Planctomycetales bacterium]